MTAAEIDYARLVAWGWDTVQEAWRVRPSEKLAERLEAAKQRAREADDNLKAYAPIRIGDLEFMVGATGAKGGARWRLEHDLFILTVRGPNAEWSLTVRYLAVGLWRHGWEVLHDYLRQAISGDFIDGDDGYSPRVTRADYAFDFYAPAFSGEIAGIDAEHFIAPPHSKRQVVSKGRRTQTVTLGSIRALQVTLYDKSAEITEASGKAWMEHVWATSTHGEVLYADKPADVWRIEVRFGKEFLKQRNARAIDDVRRYRPEMIAEALHRFRLTVPNAADTNSRRWPMHPLWSLAHEHAGADSMLAVGYRATGRRAALIDRLERQVAGTLISQAALSQSEPDDDELDALAARAAEIAKADRERARKHEAASSRYELLDERF